MARVSPKMLALIFTWSVCILVMYSLYPSSSSEQLTYNTEDNSTLLRISSKLSYLENELEQKSEENEKLVRRLTEMNILRQQDQHNHSEKVHSDNTHEVQTNLTEHPLTVPNLFQLMPHLEGDIRTLYPHRSVGHAKHNVEVVMAVPTVKRENVDYLVPTIKSLIAGMSAGDKRTSVIVVMVAEPWNEDYFNNVSQSLQEQFSEDIKNGLVEIILPPAKWYPDLDHLPEKWGDKPERARWRTKQNLDYAFMMLYCSHIGRLYVQLEDDIIAKADYISSMKASANSLKEWQLLEFSQLGFIGKMFHSDMLPKFVSFLLMFYQHKPVDWLLDNYFWVQECHGKTCSNLQHIRKRIRPSLFQHEGLHSSLPGKEQKLKDKDFGKSGSKTQHEPAVIKHDNPEASLETSLKVYSKYSLDKLYGGSSVFWSLNPQPDDYILITFKQPQSIKSYRIISGDVQHKDDKFGKNTTLQFLPAGKGYQLSNNMYKDGQSNFITFQTFNTTYKRVSDNTDYSAAVDSIPDTFGKISAVKIINHLESQVWLIINEMWFET